MSTRRRILGAAAAAGAVAAYTLAKGKDRYEKRVPSTWRHSEERPNAGTALQRELIRYATLAPSSHNTQCWRFQIGDGSISILPDLSRRWTRTTTTSPSARAVRPRIWCRQPGHTGCEPR